MKHLFLLILVLVGGENLWAQGKLTEEKRKEFEAQKVAFFTQIMDLSPAEAAVFWPLYNEMQKKMGTLEGENRKRAHDMREMKGVKEQNYKEAIENMLATETRIQDVKKEYYQKMLKVLPASKIWKLGEAERRFHRQLFDKLRRESCPKK